MPWEAKYLEESQDIDVCLIPFPPYFKIFEFRMNLTENGFLGLLLQIK